MSPKVTKAPQLAILCSNSNKMEDVKSAISSMLEKIACNASLGNILALRNGLRKAVISKFKSLI
jgi:hypothetical protein